MQRKVEAQAGTASIESQGGRRLTVVIPSYNHEPFVAQAIRSVFAQTYRPLELVVIDDDTTTRGFKRELRWNAAYHRLAEGL